MSTQQGGAAIALKDVAFAYPGGREMRFDLAIAAGVFTAIMGPSGSGKSTMLAILAGFERPLSGTVCFDGRDMTRARPSDRPVSMVFQENNLFSHLDVAANVGLGRSPSLKLGAEDRAAIADALNRTGLAGKEKRLPGELSGGERQRVALARVLVRDKPVLLLDEAFASLGPALKDEMLDLLSHLHATRGMTVLMATHDPQDAARVAQDIVFIENGRVAASGAASAFLAGGFSSAFDRYAGGGERRGSPESRHGV